MNKRILTTVAMATLACALIAPIGSAAAQGGGGAANLAGPQALQGENGPIVLRRDGDRAVPFAPVIPVAGPVTPVAASGDESFDVGDALVGAAAACASLTVALACVWVIRRRRAAEYLVRRPA